MPELIYRTEDFPGMGFMMPRRVYDQFLKNDFEECCTSRCGLMFQPLILTWLPTGRTFEGWTLKLQQGARPNIVVPDVSRVSRDHVAGMGNSERKVYDMFRREHSFAKCDLIRCQFSHIYSTRISLPYMFFLNKLLAVI